MLSTNSGKDRLRLLWACAFTLVMLLNLDQFGAAVGVGPQPKYWAIGIFVISFMVSLPDPRIQASLPNPKMQITLQSPLTWWVGAYFVLSGLWILPALDRESALDGLAMVATTTLYVLSAILIYPSVRREERLWGVTLWFALLIACTSIFIDYFSGGFSFFSEVGQGILGRASGLYLNANIASFAILMILTCILLRSSRWMSLFAILLTLPALLLTFSRSGMLGWLVLVVVTGIRGRLPRFSIAALVLTGAAIVVVGPTVFDAVSALIAPENRNSMDRLAWFLGQGHLADDATSERQWIADFAWGEFLNSPIFGHGLGYTWVWSPGIGTHNMILRHIVEYGGLGFLIFPLFLICSICSANSLGSRGALWSMAAVMIMMSFFSHNMLEQGVFVLPWLACCLMSPAEVNSRPQLTPSRLSQA